MEAKMSLKLLIDTQNQKVLFAEADQKAIHFLSHFLTLPMPTLLNLLDERKMFGCLANLCQGDGEENYETLVDPRTPVGYTCNGAHNYFSDDPNAASACPKCSQTMSVKMTYVAPPAAKGSAAGSYMVMDDLVVNPVLSAVSAFASLSKFNLKVDFATLEEKVVDFGLYEALELLKTSLSISEAVLTTVFLKKEGKKNFKAMVAGVWSNDGNTQLDSTIHIEELLSIEKGNPCPIQQVIEAGIVPRLVEFLLRDDFSQLQQRAALILGDIACGTADHKKAVIDHGALPRLVKLLSSPSHENGEVAVWALGKIAADSQECRDLVLSHGALAPLLGQLNDEHAKLSMLRTATWALSKICSGDLDNCFDQLRVVLPVLEKLVMNSTDEEVLSGACFTLSCLSMDCTDDKVQAVIDSGVCPRLIQLLQHSPPKVLLHALNTIANIVSGDDNQTQCILDALSHLLKLLKGNYNVDITSAACRTIANIITVGSWDHIWGVINFGISSALINLLQNAESIDIKDMAALAISNAICGSSRGQIKHLVKQGCIKPMCDLLVCPDPDVITPCLEALEKLVKVDPTDYAQMIIDAGGLEKLLKIKNHGDSDVCKMAKFIISKISK